LTFSYFQEEIKSTYETFGDRLSWRIVGFWKRYQDFNFKAILIHYFRLGLNQQNDQPRSPGLLQGSLGDAFFEPLPEEELQQWEKDI
jgi:hypothetical protein